MITIIYNHLNQIQLLTLIMLACSSAGDGMGKKSTNVLLPQCGVQEIGKVVKIGKVAIMVMAIRCISEPTTKYNKQLPHLKLS